ncbi:MAG: nuclease [Gammaproteobacteria bacterium]|nr:nuclease [Gammaproteobacteria bacterium]
MKRFFAIILLLLSGHAGAAREYEGRAQKIIDGDSVDVLTKDRQIITVRLSQIDAPEREQAFGKESGRSLSDLLIDKELRIIEENVDNYKRIVGRVYAGELDAGAEQIKRGMAWVYTQYTNDPKLNELEKQARAAKRGLWSEPNPVPPWKYRRAENGGKKNFPASSIRNPPSGPRTKNPMYLWKDPDTGTIYMSGKRPHWYKNPNPVKKPRTEVYENGYLVDVDKP